MALKRNSFHTNDGVKISYQSSQQNKDKECLILIHGFTGSSEYFVRNLVPLAEECSVIAYDLRGHGESGHSVHGAHISRQAADLHDLILHIRLDWNIPRLKFTGIGCSIGAAVLWAYVELFSCADFNRFVFVDQAPLQNYTANGDWGPDSGNYGCHDSASAAWNQASLIMDFEKSNHALVASCLGYRFKQGKKEVSAQQAAEDERFFVNISNKCNPNWVAKLMGDHTAYDHRETIKCCITVPVLVIAGRYSGCFPTKGCFETAHLINESRPHLAATISFDAGHWLFYEEAELFNKKVLNFISA